MSVCTITIVGRPGVFIPLFKLKTEFGPFSDKEAPQLVANARRNLSLVKNLPDPEEENRAMDMADTVYSFIQQRYQKYHSITDAQGFRIGLRSEDKEQLMNYFRMSGFDINLAHQFIEPVRMLIRGMDFPEVRLYIQMMCRREFPSSTKARSDDYIITVSKTSEETGVLEANEVIFRPPIYT